MSSTKEAKKQTKEAASHSKKQTAPEKADCARQSDPGSTCFQQRYLGNSHLQSIEAEPGVETQTTPLGVADRAAPGTIFQTKLMVSQPSDRYEREADKIASLVLQAPVRRTQQHRKDVNSLLQGESGLGQISPLTQIGQASGQAHLVTPGIESRIQSLKCGGQPLPESTRAFFEPRFGYDFSRVRVHSDLESAEIARAVSARALTTGRDIILGEGQYDPETIEGKRLIAHELTHIVHQREGTRSDGLQRQAIITAISIFGSVASVASGADLFLKTGIRVQEIGLGKEAFLPRNLVHRVLAPKSRFKRDIIGIEIVPEVPGSIAELAKGLTAGVMGDLRIVLTPMIEYNMPEGSDLSVNPLEMGGGLFPREYNMPEGFDLSVNTGIWFDPELSECPTLWEVDVKCLGQAQVDAKEVPIMDSPNKVFVRRTRTTFRAYVDVPGWNNIYQTFNIWLNPYAFIEPLGWNNPLGSKPPLEIERYLPEKWEKS